MYRMCSVAQVVHIVVLRIRGRHRVGLADCLRFRDGEEYLKFRGSFGALVCCQMGFAARINGIERPEESTGRSQFIGSG